MRTILATVAALAVAAPLQAQGHEQHTAAKAADPLPAGWQVRTDRPDPALEGVKFVAMGDGYHATMGARTRAIFYDPSNVATGEYRARATFTQTKAPAHPEAYGLILAGMDLAGENQDYLYFLVRQDGKFLVKHRAGAETHTLVDWTEHAAVKKADENGKATNTLAVEVAAADVRFLVNGTEVAKLPRMDKLNTDGIVGLRVNHHLDLHIGGFAVEKAGS